jgi:general secretion pathway protein I
VRLSSANTFRMRRYPTDGFTLMEVMVALAILAIALTSIYRLHSQTLTMSYQARFYSQAPLLAEAKLAEVERQGIKESTDNSGDFGESYPNYTWAVTIEEVSSDLIKESRYHLVRIEVTISQNEENTYTLRTYRFYAD